MILKVFSNLSDAMIQFISVTNVKANPKIPYKNSEVISSFPWKGGYKHDSEIFFHAGFLILISDTLNDL